LHATLAKFLVTEVTRQSEDTSPASEALTPREREVLTYIADGYTSREIADTLVISIKTVDRHRENIMSKLNLHNRVELVKYAIEKGLINLSS
jgi:DNA-binding NarL/FixJ family response regulator